VIERLLQKGVAPPVDVEQSPKDEEVLDNMLVVRDSFSPAISLSTDLGGEVVGSVRLSDDASINNRNSITENSNNNSNYGIKGEKKNYFNKLTSFFNGKKGNSSSPSPTSAVASPDSPTLSSSPSSSSLSRRQSSSSAKEILADTIDDVKDENIKSRGINAVKEIGTIHIVEEDEVEAAIVVEEGGVGKGEDSTIGPTRRSSELDYSAVYDDKDNDISRFEELYSELKQDAFAAPNEISPIRRLLLQTGSKSPASSPSSIHLVHNKRDIHS